MTAKPLPSVLVALGGRASAEPDADLLARFVAGDQATFAELVRRYARLVWRVARTRCRTESAAEDVFQAAFVVLARKAGSIRSGGAVAGWLHCTAHRLAVRAAKKERPAVPLHADAPVSADPLDALTARELLAAVDDELAKLADGERAVLALCGIDGLTNDEAAKRLGTSAGAVKGRLERARAKLRLRLDARGLALPAVALGLIGGPTAAAVQAALAIPLGGAIPPGIERLIAEGLGMSGSCVKTALLLALVAALVAVGGGDGGSTNRATAAPVPKAGEDDGLIWLHNTKTGTLTAYTPDGKIEKEVAHKLGPHFHGLTPDGAKLAFAGKNGQPAAGGDTDGLTLHLRGLGDTTGGTDTGLPLKPGDAVHWSPDGKQVVRVRWGPEDKAGGLTYEHVLFDLATKKETKIDLPVNHYMTGWAADGRTWHLHEYVRADLRNPALPRYRMMSVPAGGGNVTQLCDDASLTTFEPAGGAAFHGVGNIHKNPADDTDATYVRWFRVSDGQATLVKQFDDLYSVDLRPSLDRKRVAVLGLVSRDDPSDVVLRLYDADGGNELKLVTLEKAGPHTRLLGWFPKHTPDARRRNAPVPKPVDRRVVWSEPVRVDWKASGAGQINGVWTPDGKSVVVPAPLLSADGKPLPGGGIDFRDPATGEVTASLRYPHASDTAAFQPTVLAVAPNGRTVAAAGSVYATGKSAASTRVVSLWPGLTDQGRVELPTPADRLEFSPDGKRLATLNRTTQDDDKTGLVRVWDAASRKLLFATRVRNRPAAFAYCHPKEDALFVGGAEGTVFGIQASSGQILLSLNNAGMQIHAIATSADGKVTAFGGTADGGAALHLMAADAPTVKDAVPEKEQIHGLAFSPSGKHLATACSDGVVRVFEVATGKLAATAKSHTAEVFSVAYAPDGRRLLTVGRDAVKVWDVEELMKGK